MHCKHLLHYSYTTRTWSVASCSASKSPYVPSLAELEKFCQSGRHAVCPAYLLSLSTGCPTRENRIPARADSGQLNRQRSA